MAPTQCPHPQPLFLLVLLHLAVRVTALKCTADPNLTPSIAPQYIKDKIHSP